jgi:hypothetical protein
MPEHAKVSSIDAIESFKTSLIVYLEKAGRVLDEISDQVVRTRLWLEHDQRLHLENQVRLRTRSLELKQQELFSARFADLHKIMPLHQAAVREAKRALDEAEEKLSRLKHWRRQYDHQVVPLAKDVDKLREVLQRDMRNAVASLAQTVNTLHAYTGAAPVPANPPDAPATTAESTPDSKGPP